MLVILMRKSCFVTLTFMLSATAVDAQTIGVSMANMDKFQQALASGLTKAGAKVPGLEIKMESAGGDADKQMQMVKKMVADKVDALIVGPADGDMGTELSKIANDAGIPLVYVNNEPANLADLPPKQALVASDEKDSGTLETREVCRRLNGKGSLVVLMGELFHAAARKRTDDVTAVLATDECKGIKVVERQSASWSRDLAEVQMQEWLAAGVKFDAVIANNDEMALGAIKAMKKANMPMNKVVVAGVDATDDALAAIVAGDLDVTILQNAAGQGAGAVDAAVKLINGEKVEKTIYVPFELVTSDNVNRYLPKSQ
jgi:ribose transport system substrate-binding protein/inositol transport system substrate-binding protein